ncbi:MAG: hypothetical protein V4719_12520, partial [Planctomycetota bacterium]
EHTAVEIRIDSNRQPRTAARYCCDLASPSSSNYYTVTTQYPTLSSQSHSPILEIAEILENFQAKGG